MYPRIISLCILGLSGVAEANGVLADKVLDLHVYHPQSAHEVVLRLLESMTVQSEEKAVDCDRWTRQLSLWTYPRHGLLPSIQAQANDEVARMSYLERRAFEQVLSPLVDEFVMSYAQCEHTPEAQKAMRDLDQSVWGELIPAL